jgi:hypothetical protein
MTALGRGQSQLAIGFAADGELGSCLSDMPVSKEAERVCRILGESR